jgi:biotin operon repressor
MKYFTDMSTEDLYKRIVSLAHEGVDFDLDEQDYYVNEIRQVLDELDDRIYKAICEKDE